MNTSEPVWPRQTVIREWRADLLVVEHENGAEIGLLKINDAGEREWANRSLNVELYKPRNVLTVGTVTGINWKAIGAQDADATETFAVILRAATRLAREWDER